MSITPTPQQLTLAGAYENARNLAAHEDDLSLTKPLILLDLSVEQMLNQLFRDFDRDFAPNLTGEGMWAGFSCDDLMRQALPAVC